MTLVYVIAITKHRSTIDTVYTAHEMGSDLKIVRILLVGDGELVRLSVIVASYICM